MRDIFFDEATHTYLVDGQEVPSVTEILKPLHRSYGKVNASVLEYAANRGKAVHAALELFDLGGELEASPETEGYIRAYLEWQSVYRPKWTAVEQIVWSGLFGYAGTLDRAGFLNGGEFAIVDLKTSQATKESLVSVCCQTAAYEIAFNEHTPQRGYKRYGLFLKSDGTYRLVDCEEYESKYKFSGYKVFHELRKTNELITKLLERGKK